MPLSADNQAVSEWLSESVDSHAIQNHASLSKDFTEATGEQPCWPSHTVKQARQSIKKRGLGGNCAGPDDDLVCYGYEVADALAWKYADKFSSTKFGRGSSFRECLAEIRKTELIASGD